MKSVLHSGYEAQDKGGIQKLWFVGGIEGVSKK